MPGDAEDHGHRRSGDGPLRAPHFDGHGSHAVAIQLEHAAHVESAREQARLTGDDDGRFRRGRFDGCDDLAQYFGVQRIDRWPRQPQLADAFGMVDGLEHGHSSATETMISRSTAVAKLPADSANRSRSTSSWKSQDRSRTRSRSARRSALMRSDWITVMASGKCAATDC